jgi:hypothetical protein
MKHKTAELDGAMLDAAVAMAKGDEPGADFSTSWHHAGPIIQRERIEILPTLIEWDEAAGEHRAEGFRALYDGGCDYDHCWVGEHEQEGRTMLIAAMRAYVASKFGEEVDL